MDSHAPQPPSPWLTLPEAAEYLRCSSATLRRAAHRGDLRVALVGQRVWRFRREWLDAYAERQATPVELTLPREGRHVA
jgi:excisionase family DNA binding protein